jgi:hypothetical protein
VLFANTDTGWYECSINKSKEKLILIFKQGKVQGTHRKLSLLAAVKRKSNEVTSFNLTVTIQENPYLTKPINNQFTTAQQKRNFHGAELFPLRFINIKENKPQNVIRAAEACISEREISVFRMKRASANFTRTMPVLVALDSKQFQRAMAYGTSTHRINCTAKLLICESTGEGGWKYLHF